MKNRTPYAFNDINMFVKILFLTGKVCKTMLCVSMILSFCVKDALSRFYVALAKTDN